MGREKYDRKRRFGELCEDTNKGKRKKMENKKCETEAIWNHINEGRKKKTHTGESIKIEEWTTQVKRIEEQ